MNIDIKYIYAGVGFLILLLFIVHTRRSSYSLKNGLFNLAEFRDLPSGIKTAISNNIMKISTAISNLPMNQQQDFIKEMNMGIDRMISRQTANQYNSSIYDANFGKVSDKFSM